MYLDTSFDTQLHQLKRLNWLPWVGSNYQNRRVLLVGESHYDDGDGWLEYRNATRRFVNNQGLNSFNPDFSKRKFFQQIEKTLLNANESTLTQRDSLWKNVAFCNLVQRLLPSIDERPTESDYDNGWQNFLDVLDILKPQVCIKYGYEGVGRLGYLLHNDIKEWARDDISEFYSKPYCINLTKEDYRVRIVFTYHPTGSFGFDYSEWAAHIRKQFPEVDTLFN